MPGAGAKKEEAGRQTGEGTGTFGMGLGRRELYGLFCSEF